VEILLLCATMRKRKADTDETPFKKRIKLEEVPRITEILTQPYFPQTEILSAEDSDSEPSETCSDHSNLTQGLEDTHLCDEQPKSFSQIVEEALAQSTSVENSDLESEPEHEDLPRSRASSVDLDSGVEPRTRIKAIEIPAEETEDEQESSTAKENPKDAKDEQLYLKKRYEYLDIMIKTLVKQFGSYKRVRESIQEKCVALGNLTPYGDRKRLSEVLETDYTLRLNYITAMKYEHIKACLEDSWDSQLKQTKLDWYRDWFWLC